MTLTSSPGFSLMLEGISYLIGAQLPAVIFNVMRGGPGLGNIAPAQEDIKLVCRGLGHGNTHAIVFPAQLDERDIEILRQMTPEQKLAVMRSLIRQAYALKEAGVRALHPELSEEEIQARTRAAVAGDRS